MTNPKIKSKDFYDFAQFYRHMPIAEQSKVVAAYSEMISNINALIDQAYEQGKKDATELQPMKPVATYKRFNKGGSGEFICVEWNIPEADIPDDGCLLMPAWTQEQIDKIHEEVKAMKLKIKPAPEANCEYSWAIGLKISDSQDITEVDLLMPPKEPT